MIENIARSFKLIFLSYHAHPLFSSDWALNLKEKKTVGKKITCEINADVYSVDFDQAMRPNEWILIKRTKKISRNIWHYMTSKDNQSEDQKTGWMNNILNLIVWIWIEICDNGSIRMDFFFILFIFLLLKKLIFQFCERFTLVECWIHLFLILSF